MGTTTECPQCHAELQPGMLRCRSCGARLNKAAAATSTTTPPSAPGPPIAGTPAPVATAAAAAMGGTAFSLPALPSTTTPVPPTRAADAGKTPPAPGSNRQPRPAVAKETTPLPKTSATVSTGASAILEIPAHSDLNDKADAGRLVVTCVCSARFRVKQELAGKRIKCPKCQQGLTVPCSDDQPTVTVSGRMARPDLPVTRSFAEMATELEQLPPLVTETVELKRKLSSRKLKQLTERITKKDGEGKAEAELRRIAILELAESADVRALEQIQPLATDYWISVREGVALALGTLRDPAGLPTLVRLLGDEVGEVRREAVAALGKMGDARAVLPLLTLALQEPLFRYSAGEAIVRIGLPAVPCLVQCLQDEDPGRTLEAIVVLGRIKSPAAAEPLETLLRHRYVVIRGHAAEALGLIGQPRSIPALLSTLADVDAGVRAQVAAALLRFGDKRAVGPLIKLLQDDDADVCERAAMALGELGDARATAGLLPLLQRAEPEVRGAAAEALGKLADETAAEPLTQLFHDEDESVRLKSVSAFRRFRSESATAPLLLLLDDGNVQIRQRAVDALGEIGNPAALDRLVTILRSDGALEVRMSAAKALGQLKSVKAIKALEEALDDDLAVRCRAITAIGEIGDATSLPALLAMLRDPTPEVRYHASQALATLGHQNSRKPLEALLGDESTMVRRGAAKALIKLNDPRGEKLLELVADAPRTKKKSSWQSWMPDVVLGLLSPNLSGGGAKWLAVPAVAVVLLIGWFVAPLATGLFARPVTLVLRGNVRTLDFSPDGQRLLMGRTEGLLETWSTAGEFQRQIELGDFGNCSAAVFGGEGDTLYVAAASRLRKYTAAGFEDLPSHEGPVVSLIAGSDGKKGMSLAGTTIHIWDLVAGKIDLAIQIEADYRTINNFRMAADGTTIAWVDLKTFEIVIFDAQTTAIARRIPIGGKWFVTGLALDRTASRVAVYIPQQGLIVWNVKSGARITQIPATKVASECLNVRFLEGAGAENTLLLVGASRVDRIDLATQNVETVANYTFEAEQPLAAIAVTGKWVSIGSPATSEVLLLDLAGKGESSLDREL